MNSLPTSYKSTALSVVLQSQVLKMCIATRYKLFFYMKYSCCLYVNQLIVNRCHRLVRRFVPTEFSLNLMKEYSDQTHAWFMIFPQSWVRIEAFNHFLSKLWILGTWSSKNIICLITWYRYIWFSYPSGCLFWGNRHLFISWEKPF